RTISATATLQYTTNLPADDTKAFQRKLPKLANAHTSAANRMIDIQGVRKRRCTDPKNPGKSPFCAKANVTRGTLSTLPLMWPKHETNAPRLTIVTPAPPRKRCAASANG